MDAPMRVSFRAAVERVLNSWTVLKLAVSHGFGGIDSQAKEDWMVIAVDQWFSENANIDPYECEEFLAEVLNNEFDTVADDGSLSQISQMVCGCYKLCADGNEVALQERLDKLPKPALQNCVQQNVSQDASDDDSGDDDTAPPLVPPTQPAPSTSHTEHHHSSQDQMEVDEDGWQTVPKKGKKR